MATCVGALDQEEEVTPVVTVSLGRPGLRWSSGATESQGDTRSFNLL